MTQKRGWLFAASLAALTLAACSLGDGVDNLQGGDAAAAGASGQGSSGKGGGSSGLGGGGTGGSSAGGAGTGGSATGGSGTGGAGSGGSGGSQNGGSGGSGGSGTGGGTGTGGSGGVIAPDCEAGEGAFCDGFESKTPGATWTDTEVTGIGMALGSLAPGNGTPQALLVAAEPPPDEVERRARLLESFAAPTLVQCFVDLFIDEYEGNVSLLEFALDRPGFVSYRTTFAVNGDQAGLEVFTETEQGEPFFDRRAVGMPPLGAWSRVALEISAADGARLFYGDSAIAQLDLDLTDVTEATLSLGIVAVGASGTISFGFDELSCSFK